MSAATVAGRFVLDLLLIPLPGIVGARRSERDTRDMLRTAIAPRPLLVDKKRLDVSAHAFVGIRRYGAESPGVDANIAAMRRRRASARGLEEDDSHLPSALQTASLPDEDGPSWGNLLSTHSFLRQEMTSQQQLLARTPSPPFIARRPTIRERD